MNNILSCEERVAGNGDPSFSVIWLHGLGADGNDFIPVLPYLNLNGLATRFVFPNAPAIPVTINSGMVMPAWYDIRAGDLSTRHDQDGIRLSARQIEGLLAREKERGIPAERIVLAGFSQGGAIALHVGLRHAEQLAGVIALSTYLVLEHTLDEERSAANTGTPIFQVHGSLDPVVEVQRGEACRDQLAAAGYTLEWSTYPMRHEVCMEELVAVGGFLRRVLSLDLPSPRPARIRPVS